VSAHAPNLFADLPTGLPRHPGPHKAPGCLDDSRRAHDLAGGALREPVLGTGLIPEKPALPEMIIVRGNLVRSSYRGPF
jgi:hypothetical protein